MVKRKLLKADEVAALLDVKRWRVYDLTRAGILPHVRVGPRQLRYDPEQIEEFIANGGITADPGPGA